MWMKNLLKNIWLTAVLILMSVLGSFPQDDFPEDVSTDEDEDDSFSRRKLKRKSGKPLDKAQLGKKGRKKRRLFPDHTKHLFLITVC